ncbi:YebC/PmpR family DNA-binding transcriptional regulator [Lentisphaerota bacterium WC36G]|nr:YebC/PmpR family DNA-binding transcriptional regulator [Lentisphaerae bacterium WC36]
MAGHSKWANIKHKKAATDKKKGKIFSRFAKEIMVAAKEGGGDIDMNPKLRTAVAAAKAQNMPNDNIDRAIKKGTGELGDVVFEEIMYEAYGPEGVAMLIECLTDNRNRSASDVRATLTRGNGSLAGSGAVAWMFKRMSHFIVTGDNADEDILMDVVLDAGAEDIEVEDGIAEIWGPASCFEDCMKAFEDAKIATDTAEIIFKAENDTELKDASVANKILALVDKLEDLDDVQAVHANYVIDDSIADQIDG